MMDESESILIINYEYPPLGGGAGTASRETARALAGMGHRVTVLTSAFAGLARDETADGVRVVRVAAARRRMDAGTPAEMALFAWNASRAAPALAREAGARTALCFFSIPGGIAGLRLRNATGLPYIVSLRGGDVPGFHPGALAAYHKLTLPLTRRIWRGAAAVTANAENLKQLALKTMPELDISVIPNGVDTVRFHPAAEALAPGNTALFVGRLNSQKGLDCLLRALAGVRAELPDDFRLILAGGGPEESRLKALARERGIDRLIEFRGWVPPEKIPEIYSEADVFVLPSRDEGMPNAALEALASGLPVITTDIQGCAAIVEHGVCGRIVPRTAEGEPVESELGRALIEMLNSNPDNRRAMSRAARARALTFSWENTARQFLELIKNQL